jgi:hypothetical protein
MGPPACKVIMRELCLVMLLWPMNSKRSSHGPPPSLRLQQQRTLPRKSTFNATWFRETSCTADNFMLTHARVAARTPNIDEPHNGTLVYIQFSKVGSSTMRKLIETVHGTLCDYTFAHTDFKSRSPTCNHSPELLSVVQGKFGLCESSPALRERRCGYMTQLRDPIEKMKSSYNYFCQRCSEGGRHCKNKHFVSKTGKKCPQMSILDYAKLIGNEYVLEFSGALACAPCHQHKPTVQRPYSEACGIFHSISTLDGEQHGPSLMLQRALENLKNTTLPVILEDGVHLDLQAVASVFHWSSIGKVAIKHENAQVYHHVERNTTTTDLALATLLSEDRAFYDAARLLAAERRMKPK